MKNITTHQAAITSKISEMLHCKCLVKIKAIINIAERAANIPIDQRCASKKSLDTVSAPHHKPNLHQNPVIVVNSFTTKPQISHSISPIHNCINLNFLLIPISIYIFVIRIMFSHVVLQFFLNVPFNFVLHVVVTK